MKTATPPHDFAPVSSGAPVARLSVLVPAYNERATIDVILARVLARSEVAEVIVVDDASGDGTWERLQEWPARDGRVRVLRHERNRGKGAAVRTALAAASAEVVIIQDADLEYDPADFAVLLRCLDWSGADAVYGSRFLGQRFNWARPLHTAGNGLLTLIGNAVTGQRITDEATCYKLVRRELMNELDLSEEGFGLCPEITAKLARRGIRIVEMPIRYHGRTAAEGKKISLWHGFEAVWCLCKWRWLR